MTSILGDHEPSKPFSKVDHRALGKEEFISAYSVEGDELAVDLANAVSRDESCNSNV